MRVLKAGGNAVDAAIAAWAIQGEVEPGMTGLGADMFALIYLAKTGEVKFINGTGFAPQAATIDFYNSHGGMPDDGGLSIAVPGAVGGAALALQKYGTKTMADVLAPAIEIAEQGYPDHRERSRAASRAARPSSASSRRPRRSGSATASRWQMGDVIKNPDLAQTLRAIASAGPGRLLHAARSPRALRRRHEGARRHHHRGGSGQLRRRSRTRRSRVNYRGYDVYECPPNSQGFMMLEALNMLEGFNLRYMGHNSAPYLHVVTESIKLAFADRNKYVGRSEVHAEHPDARAAVEGVRGDAPRADRSRTAPSSAKRRPATRAAARPSSAGRQAAYAAPQPCPAQVNPFDPDKVLNLTTYLTVVDKDHNMVSLTSSLLSGFGSGLVPEGTGLMMNDRMRYFYLDPEGRQLAAADQARAPDHQPGAWR